MRQRAAITPLGACLKRCVYASSTRRLRRRGGRSLRARVKASALSGTLLGLRAVGDVVKEANKEEASHNLRFRARTRGHGLRQLYYHGERVGRLQRFGRVFAGKAAWRVSLRRSSRHSEAERKLDCRGPTPHGNSKGGPQTTRKR